MLDSVFALGQFICLAGLASGAVLALANWRYSGAAECRSAVSPALNRSSPAPDTQLTVAVVPDTPALVMRVVPAHEVGAETR